MAGPLEGVRIIEFRGLGPAPFAAMLLSDMGADVVRIDRFAQESASVGPDVLSRNRRSIAIDLKRQEGLALALDLATGADGLIEGFRPGTMERLGLGPDACLERNPRLVYGRMTGWGQTGPYANRAGHDLNYIALTGALAAIGRRGEPPAVPLALVGDFGGGGMLMAFGMTAALYEASRSGRGQVVDAAIIDGVALMMSTFSSRYSRGDWSLQRGSNLVDSGRPFYDVYECADGEYVSVAALEPAFYARLLKILQLDDLDANAQHIPDGWEPLRRRLREVFLTRTRDEWSERLQDPDLCFAPVVSMAEAPNHPHHAARGTYTTVDGLTQGAVAPRLSRTPGAVSRPLARSGQHTDEILRELGIKDEQIQSLRQQAVVG